MDKKKVVFASTLLSAAVSTVSPAQANDKKSVVPSKVECKGVALEFINDCAANGHECAAQAKKDWDKNEWLQMKSDADCKRIQQALKSDVMKKYVENIRDQTIALTKRGKFGK